MTQIPENLRKIVDSLPENVQLVAVTKTKPESDIQQAYDAGHRDFGENKIQELVNKQPNLPNDIKWHMIGHLQRNKVKYIAKFVHLIHGVDSFKTLKEINKQALKHERIINCLLQIKIASEESKFGLSMAELHELVQNEELKSLENIKIIGFMGMASFTNDQDQVKKEFQQLKRLFDSLQHCQSKNMNLETLSMGMSGDYSIAIDAGSTMIRVGSAIFGERNYK